MKLLVRLSILVMFIFFSCNNSQKEVDKLEIATAYYQALNSFDASKVKPLLSDSLVIREMDYDYTQAFSQKQYITNWMKWDALFNPSYTLLEISQEGDIVKAKISKLDQRILFLHKEPTIWNAAIHFEYNKIVRIENTNVAFNDSIWSTNANALVKWIDKNHPELNGFIYDQTESGGIKYLKALKLYESRE